MASKFPPLTIVVTTYLPFGDEALRGIAIQRTLSSWLSYLRYKGKINLHFADDGSKEAPVNLGDWIHHDITYSRQERHGVGASLNAGFRQAFETSPLVAYFVDDWALTEHFDITPWVQVLLERQDVGMVRLGPPHPGISGTVEAFTDNWQSWGLRLDQHHYAFGHRPALYHKRLIDCVGWFDEDCSALECERLYNERWANHLSSSSRMFPDIVLALPHPWRHLDSISMSGMEPKDG